MSEGSVKAFGPEWARRETYVKETALTKEPRSAGEAMSEITPYPMGWSPFKVSSEKTKVTFLPPGEVVKASPTRDPKRL